jgi:hypothetical protein
MLDEELQCPVAGWYYSGDGIVGAKAQVSGGASVGGWTLDKKLVVAVPVIVPAQSPVPAVVAAPVAPVDSPVDGVDALTLMAANRAGLDDLRRPASTFRGVVRP